MLGKLDWINKDALIAYILSCQDPTDGGIADRPGNVADVFHTFFGIGGLSLLGYFDTPEAQARFPHFKTYRNIHPVFALPVHLVEKLGLSCDLLISSQ